MFKTDSFWPYFDRLRKEAPVHHCKDSMFGPYWSITKYNDIMDIETQHAAFDTVSCKAIPGVNLDGTAVKGTALLTNATPSQIGSVGWNSDFANSGHTTGALAFTVNLDGSGYSGQATYPAG